MDALGTISNGSSLRNTADAGWLERVNDFLYNDFIFDSRYRVMRHVTYWTFHILVWAFFWWVMDTDNLRSYGRYILHMLLFMPVFVSFSYPMVYIVVPKLLLKGRIWQFILVVLAWGVSGIFINAAFRNYIFVPLQEWMGLSNLSEKGFQAPSYLCMMTSAASPMIIRFFKLWTLQQKKWMEVQQEKLNADLQLLRGEIQPHFFINTLESIHNYAVSKSAKTPQQILKLSNLLSYILYDCKSPEVRLEKDLEMMRTYVELENDRHMGRMDLSWNASGDLEGPYIAPLLILPLLENAFRHGISRNIQRSWLGVDISSRNGMVLVKIANSKDPEAGMNEGGQGLKNLRTRLAILYPGSHELKVNDEKDFFVVSLSIKVGQPISVKVSVKGRFLHQ